MVATKDGDHTNVAAVEVAEASSSTRSGSQPGHLILHDHERTDTLALAEETLAVSKRQVTTGVVRVSTHTAIIEEIAEASLEHRTVEVTRVPVGRVVDVAPDIRTKGDLTIVPVLEERFVIVKQLYLTEEVHIRRRLEAETQQIPVQLRRQTATVERVDADGNVLPLSDFGDGQH